MMIDMNGPDIEAVDEVKALILESVKVWKNCKKRVPYMFSTVWSVGVVKSVKKKYLCCWPVSGQV